MYILIILGILLDTSSLHIIEVNFLLFRLAVSPFHTPVTKSYHSPISLGSQGQEISDATQTPLVKWTYKIKVLLL